MSILEGYNNIEKNLRRNNFTVLGLIALVGIMIICFSVYVYKTATYFSNNQFVLDNGEVRKISLVSANEAREIEAKDHIARFYASFYTYDQFNLDAQLNTGFWLGDESLRHLYDRYKTDGWYSNIIQYNINQVAEPEEIHVDMTSYPYKVTVKGVVNLRQGDKVEKYSLCGSCILENVARNFPKNPHGLFIRNWQEEPMKKIE